MVSRDESRRQQHEIRPVSDLPVDDAFDYSGYDFDDAGNGTRTPRSTDSRLEEEGNAIRRSPPRYGNLLQPNDNTSNLAPQRNVSFKQPGKRISFATPTPENESPQSQSSSSINRSPRIREEVETFEDDDDDQNRRDDNDEVIARHPSVMKRHRWGTQRHKKGRPKRSKSIFKSKRMSTASKLSDNHNNTSTDELSETPAPASRKIYVNMPLPYDMLDDDTGLPATEYPRNKIRTTKYTPLSFIPKNLFYQFQNVANIFFLFIVILGVSSPSSTPFHLQVTAMSPSSAQEPGSMLGFHILFFQKKAALESGGLALGKSYNSGG